MKSINKKLIIWICTIIIILIVIIGLLVPHIKESKLKAKNEAEMQTLRESPAAEYCKNSWWNLDIINDELIGIYWMCYFEDWSSCEISEYLRWECISNSKEPEASYCSEWLSCNDEEDEDLSSRINDMNNIEILDEESLEKDSDEINTEKLYNYYEDGFNNPEESEWVEAMWKLQWWESFSDICEWVWWTVLKDRCFLEDGIEITF